MTEADARRTLVEAGQRLAAEGLVARSWGNVSLRLGKAMAITPSGIPWSSLTEDMISLVDLATGDWTGSWKPSGERKVHREIYLRRPEVNAVVHTHQNAASVCATARIEVPLAQTRVKCAAYALPGTKTLTRATVEALGDTPAVLLANHGAFAVGSNIDAAFQTIRGLETACADLVHAHSPQPLPARIDLPWNPRWLVPVIEGPGAGTQAWRSEAPFTLAWSSQGKALPAVLDDLAQLVGPRVKSLSQGPTTRPQDDAVLVKGAGALVWGPDAEALAMVVEKAARAVLGAEGLGGARAFPSWEASLMRWVYRNAYAKQAHQADRSVRT